MLKNLRMIFPMLVATSMLLLSSCTEPAPVLLSDAGLIPMPVSVEDGEGGYKVDANTVINHFNNSEVERIAVYLKDQLLNSTGISLNLSGESGGKGISLSLESGLGLADEAYILDIKSSGITITASQPAGLFFGVQTLRQLLDQANQKGSKTLSLGAGRIEDKPEYSYRGMMLDVARHFFPVEDVKHLIDLLAIYKINYLHLHLSDDQGWRIEIKSWPKLTEIGGSTQVGGGDAGFYTQEQYKELVAYAQERFITIVPEIDMPGHTNSALASYGQLNPGITVPEKGALRHDGTKMGVAGTETPLYTGIEVGFSTLDTKNPETYVFVEDVIRELAAITPGPYIHIGGDESHVTNLEDYIPFIEKAQEIVAKYGKKSLGWDEVAHARLLSGSVAQYWAKAENAVLAIQQGAKVLISPATKVYLDMQYDSTTQLGLHWAAYIELDDAYNWDPTTLDPAIKRSDILGVEAPLWTETITNRAEIEYMVFPRLAAISEIAWSPREKRDWENFRQRIIFHGKLWEEMGLNFYKSPKIDWE
jgi:hexosaminidase